MIQVSTSITKSIVVLYQWEMLQKYGGSYSEQLSVSLDDEQHGSVPTMDNCTHCTVCKQTNKQPGDLK